MTGFFHVKMRFMRHQYFRDSNNKTTIRIHTYYDTDHVQESISVTYCISGNFNIG